MIAYLFYFLFVTSVFIVNYKYEYINYYLFFAIYFILIFIVPILFVLTRHIVFYKQVVKYLKKNNYEIVYFKVFPVTIISNYKKITIKRNNQIIDCYLIYVPQKYRVYHFKEDDVLEIFKYRRYLMRPYTYTPKNSPVSHGHPVLSKKLEKVRISRKELKFNSNDKLVIFNKFPYAVKDFKHQYLLAEGDLAQDRILLFSKEYIKKNDI